MLSISYPIFRHLFVLSVCRLLFFLHFFFFLLLPLHAFILLHSPPSISAPLHPPTFRFLIFTCSFSLHFPSLTICLWFWAMFTKHIGTGWWSMSFAMITHMHTQAQACVRAHTDLLEMVVDEQCQTLSIHAHQTCSRNLIRPPGHSMALASILARLPFSHWDEFEALGQYTIQHPQS